MSTPPTLRSNAFRAVYRSLVTNRYLITLQSIVTLLLAWYLLATFFDLTDVISSPALAAVAFVDLLQAGEWPTHLLATLRRILYGFVVTMIVGTVLGVAMGVSDFWEDALQDYITIGLALPSLFAVIFPAMWFGFSEIVPTLAGAISAFPFIVQNVYKGIDNIDMGLLDMSSAFGVSRNKVVKDVVLMSILPEWFAGARYAFAICWKLTTLAELFVSGNGLGYMIAVQMKNLSLTELITWTFLFTVVIVVVEYAIFQQIEKRLFAWRQDTSLALA